MAQREAPQSVGLLWTSDQLVAETSTWQHTTLTTNKHPCPKRDSNPQSQQASDRRPRPYLHICVKYKCVFVHIMNAYRRNRGISPIILNYRSKRRLVIKIKPQWKKYIFLLNIFEEKSKIVIPGLGVKNAAAPKFLASHFSLRSVWRRGPKCSPDATGVSPPLCLN